VVFNLPEVFTELLHKVTNFWKELDKSQKIRIYITAAILVAALVVSIVLLTRTTYVPLITSKDTAEVNEMAALLEENGFKYEVNGNTIMIDSRSKNKAQALLVQNDYPESAGAIFADAFDKIKLSSTEGDKRKLFEEAQERTIAAKLKMLDNIEDASVDLAIPEPSVFLFSDDDIASPTASVMIKPKKQLTPEQVQAVVMWVSRSVEGLDPKDVTVVDYDLNELTGKDTSELSSDVNSQYEMKKIWSEDLERSIRKLFSGQFESFDNITVVANPVLDLDSTKSNKKILQNQEGIDGAAVISSDRSKTKIENGNVEGGAPGLESNPGTEAPTYQIDNNGENSSYDEEHEIMNYAYNEILTEEEKAIGQMIPEKSSMAINLLYGSRATDEDKINEEIEKVKQMASSATGIPVANITVNKFKIAAEAPVQQQISDRITNFLSTYGPLVLVLLLAIILLIAVIPRRKKSEEPSNQEEQVTPVPAFTVPEPVYVPEIDLEERSEIKKQIDKFIKQKPDAVAQLLRNWLSDDWDG